MVDENIVRLGEVEANLVLDQASVQMANQYGDGHPWLGCHELKFLATELAREDGRDVLVKAADEVFDGDGKAPEISTLPVVVATPPSTINTRFVLASM